MVLRSQNSRAWERDNAAGGGGSGLPRGVAGAHAERLPLDWAIFQADLGIALQSLGERESGTARLGEAAAAFRAALEELRRERVPFAWAVAENNLGNALTTLGEREGGTARLEQAVAAFRAALEEVTRERAPLEWAVSFGGQGLALMLIAERTNDVALAETSVAHIEAAYGTLRSGSHEAGQHTIRSSC